MMNFMGSVTLSMVLRVIKSISLLLILSMLLACGSGGALQDNGNMPYEPDTPAPEPHKGMFTSPHGSMTFSGDGSHVTIDFDKELSEWLGFPEGKQEAEYEFLSGNLPPHGEIPVRYDVAHIIRLTYTGEGASGISSEIDIGLYEDGNFYKGTNCTTSERITFFVDWNKDSKWEAVDFIKN